MHNPYGLPEVVYDAPLDKLNRPIKVGDYIVYGHALGRCAALRVGKVLALTHKATNIYYFDQTDYPAWDQGVHVSKTKPFPTTRHGQPAVRAEVYSDWGISVIGIDNDSNRGYLGSTRKPSLCSTKGTLQFPERTCILDPREVPRDIRDLLDPVDAGTNIRKYKELHGC